MKKLVFMFVAFAAISFASCGNKTSDAAANADSTDSAATVVVDDTTGNDTTANDSAANDTTAAEPAA